MTAPSRPEAILDFWRAVEFFSPQTVPKANPAARAEPVEVLREDALLPWEEGHRWARRPRPPGTANRFTVYCGIYSLSNVSTVLESVLGKDPESADERMDGESCLFALLVTRDGRPLLESITLSSCAWAVSRTRQPGPRSRNWLEGFEEEAERIVGQVKARLAPDEDDERARELAEKSFPVGRPLTLQDLQDATRIVAESLGVNQMLRPSEIRARCGLVSSRRPYSVDDNDFLNSFFLRDLRKVSEQVRRGNVGQGLRDYLTPEMGVDVSRRIDVRERLDVLFEQLAPNLFPQGRWPSKGHHPLVFSQQFAVNTALPSLSEAGLFAVNGPPGTGKTTLLRDLVAAIVVERAKRLANLKAPADAFTGKLNWKTGKFTRAVATWRGDLQGFEIVVASANNGAVENVTRQIPGRDAIDESWRREADYFAEYGTRILGEEAWAMIAARLGNKSNRADFLSRFWHPEDQEEEGQTKRDPARPPKPEDGFRKLLEHLQGETISWAGAVKRFRAALNAEARIREERQHIHDLFGELRDLQGKLDIAPGVETTAAALLEQCYQEQRAVQETLEQALVQVRTAQDRHESHLKTKPNWLEILFSLGGVSRTWRAREQELSQEVGQAETRAQQLRATHADATRKAERAERELQLHREEKRQWAGRLREAQNELTQARERVQNIPSLATWATDEEARELSAPWTDREWNDARAQVFLEALRLHKAFLAANAETMRRSLHAATDVLSGSVPDSAPSEAVRAAWTALFFVIPVISTTFASFDRLFSHLGREALGYLLIDEAGQAIPQAAAGALWRSKRAIVVGDPMQLEPVVTIPLTAQQALRRHFNVGELWLPSETSAQQLADRVSLYGTNVPTQETSLWVGSPLRVHRRCDQPMFNISNQIAYDGMMVFGTSPESTLDLPESCWIDVHASEAEGHFILAEGEVARQLIRNLEVQGVNKASIFVISPFRAVVRELTRILPDVRVGTVHTTQGKESDVVILVLGGNPSRAGAKTWASQHPNLLNVAVSRAKHRLYVIGNREDWQKYQFFSVLARQLPLFRN